MNFELKIGDKLCTFVALYRSPSQSRGNFEMFIIKVINQCLSRKNPFLLVAIGDFNAKSKFWYCNDNTTPQGKALENVITICIASSQKRTNTFYTILLCVLISYLHHSQI